MTYLDTLYLSDTAICARCGTDLLIDEATFCPMCGEVRVPGPSPLSEAEQRELGHGAVDAPPEHSEAMPGVPAGAPAGTDPTRAGTYAPEPPAPMPIFDTVDDDDDVAPALSPADTPDLSGAAERLVAPRAAESRVASRHYGKGARLSRLSSGDLLAAGGSAAVAVSLFLPWFRQTAGRVAVPGHHSFPPVRVVLRSADALGVGLWRWGICVISVFVVAYVAARIYPGRNVRLPLPHWQLLAVATAVNAGLVLLSVGLPPDSGHWSLGVGGDLAVIASLIALGGALLRRGDPEVITPGRTRRPARATRPARVARTARTARAARTARPDRTTTAARRAGAVRKARRERVASKARDGVDMGAEPARDLDRPTGADLADRTDFARSPGAERPTFSFATRALAREATPETDTDLECRFCGTVNTSSARVCRGCGVVTTVRLER
jgi:ribosomal protein L40E